MNEQTCEEIALGLWRAWFKWSGDPYEYDQVCVEETCFFCGEAKQDEHDENCPYVGAAKLLGEQVKCK